MTFTTFLAHSACSSAHTAERFEILLTARVFQASPGVVKRWWLCLSGASFDTPKFQISQRAANVCRARHNENKNREHSITRLTCLIFCFHAWRLRPTREEHGLHHTARRCKLFPQYMAWYLVRYSHKHFTPRNSYFKSQQSTTHLELSVVWKVRRWCGSSICVLQPLAPPTHGLQRHPRRLASP